MSGTVSPNTPEAHPVLDTWTGRRLLFVGPAALPTMAKVMYPDGYVEARPYAALALLADRAAGNGNGSAIARLDAKINAQEVAS